MTSYLEKIIKNGTATHKNPETRHDSIKKPLKFHQNLIKEKTEQIEISSRFPLPNIT